MQNATGTAHFADEIFIVGRGIHCRIMRPALAGLATALLLQEGQMHMLECMKLWCKAKKADLMIICPLRQAVVAGEEQL